MVFKRFRKQVRKVKKGTWYGRRYMAPGGATRLVKDVRWLKGQLNVERKYQDQHLVNNATPLNPGYLIFQVSSGIAQGSGTTSRSGASIKVKSIHIKGLIKQNAVGNPVGRVRVVLFTDKEPLTSGIGVAPTQAELYSQSYITSPRNFQGILMRRFKVLRDSVFTTSTDEPTKQLDWYIKTNHIIKWNPATSASTDMIEGPIYVMIWQESTAVTTNNIDMSSRLTYVDN